MTPDFLAQGRVSKVSLLYPARLGGLCSTFQCNPSPSLLPQELPHPLAQSHTCLTLFHPLPLWETQSIQDIDLLTTTEEPA